MRASSARLVSSRSSRMDVVFIAVERHLHGGRGAPFAKASSHAPFAHPHEPHRMIVEHFPVGLLQCNCVILGDEKTKRAVVVDPGDDVRRIEAALKKHGLTVTAIVATHAHIDHVGGLAELKRMTGGKTMLHEADLELYQGLEEQAQ